MIDLRTLVYGVIAVAIAAFLALAKRRNSSTWGFKDVVKNPEYWDLVSESSQELEAAIEVAKGWNDEEVASATRKFLLEATSSRDADDEAQILKALGERTHPTVLRLLRDSSLYPRLVQPTGKFIRPEAPFNRACLLLGEAPEAEAVEALAPFLSDPSEVIRKDAALAIAKTGAVTIMPLVRKALSDEEESVRSFALMGLEYALNRSALSVSMQTELFPDVLGLLQANRNTKKATDILYRFEPSKATSYFLSQEVFTSESPILHEALKVLANEKVPVSRDRLKPLIAALLEIKELKFPQNYALGEALRLLGQQKYGEDRSLLRSQMTHPDKRVAQGAATGLLGSYDLGEFKRKISDTEEQSGYESLTRQQQLYSSVFMCDAEIRNGGFAQYFVNSSGDRWPDALAGFQAMGFQDRLEVLHEAIAKFGKTGPSSELEIRRKQLSELYKRDESIFTELDNRYFKSSEVVEAFASRFVLEHPDEFR